MEERAQATDWMRELSTHHTLMRQAYPDEELCIVFDIDGTILDTRHLVVHLLYAYDREHASEYFMRLRPEDVSVHETQIGPLLDSLALPEAVRLDVGDWYEDNLWNLDGMLVAHRPYRGVLSVIRWFQLQPKTTVAVNTGRPERMREQTFNALEALGAEYRVHFDPDLLFMNPKNWEEGVPEAKARGLKYFKEMGLRVFAVVDNEPANLRAMADADPAGEILFMHADTIFTSRRESLPRTVSGSTYDLDRLVQERDLRRRVQFVWHGVNDRENLKQFLASDVHWAECDLRFDPLNRLITRHDSFDEAPLDGREEPFLAEECLLALRERGRAAKIDLKENGVALESALRVVQDLGFPDDALWFNGSLEDLGASSLRTIRDEHPGSVISCPANFIAPILGALPDEALTVSYGLREVGVTRLSLRWSLPDLREVISRVEEMGWEVNIYDIPDLAAFLEAALLLPRSVTADFNFPEWNYFGRGSGASSGHHRYSLVVNEGAQSA